MAAWPENEIFGVLPQDLTTQRHHSPLVLFQYRGISHLALELLVYIAFSLLVK